MDKKQVEVITELLKRYAHFKYMNTGFLGQIFGTDRKLDLRGFLEWLKSIED